MAADDDMKMLLAQSKVLCPGVSEAELKAVLFYTLTEFLNDSSWWTEAVSVFIVPNTTTYNVAVAPGQIVRLAGVLDQNGVPQAANMPEIGVIEFRFPYNSAATFTAVLIKTVALPRDKNDLPAIPNDLIAMWSVGLIDGIVGNLNNQPGKTYYNPKGAAYHLARFRDAISRARVAALRRNTIGTQAWRFPRSFATNNQRGGVSVGNDTRFTS